MGHGVAPIRLFPVAALLFALSAVATADIIYLDSGGFITGDIIEANDERLIVRTDHGQISVNMDEIDHVEKGSLEEIFQRRLNSADKGDADGYLKLAWWAKNVRLLKEAEEAFKRVVSIRPGDREAHEELGHVKHEGKWLTEEEYNTAIGHVQYEGRWVTREDLEKLKSGLVKYEGAWIAKEDAEKMEKGLRKLDGQWVAEEDYYTAKGLVKYKGKWIEKDKLVEAQKASRAEEAHSEELKKSGKIKAAYKVNISFEMDAQKEHLNLMAQTIKEASQCLWAMTGGAIYIEEANISDKNKDGEIIINTLEGQWTQSPNGVRCPGVTYNMGKPDSKVFLPGGCHHTVWVHEYMHYKEVLPDHYGSRTYCIMHAANPFFVTWYCDNCRQTLEKKYPGIKVPGEAERKAGKFGKPPQTKITIKNN